MLTKTRRPSPLSDQCPRPRRGRMIGVCHRFDLSGHLHTCLPVSVLRWEKIDSSIRLIDGFKDLALAIASFSTGCHSLPAAQTRLTPAGDSYSLSGFQLSVEK